MVYSFYCIDVYPLFYKIQAKNLLGGGIIICITYLLSYIFRTNELYRVAVFLDGVVIGRMIINGAYGKINTYAILFFFLTFVVGMALSIYAHLHYYDGDLNPVIVSLIKTTG